MNEEFADPTQNASDHRAEPKIALGHTAELPTGKYMVTKVEDGKVRFTHEKPDGTTISASLPEDIYRRMVATGVAAGPHKPTTVFNSQTTALDEFSPEDVADFRRLAALYRSLPEGDRLYIVHRWDHEQGLDSPQTRLAYKSDAPARKRAERGRFWRLSRPCCFVGG